MIGITTIIDSVEHKRNTRYLMPLTERTCYIIELGLQKASKAERT